MLTTEVMVSGALSVGMLVEMLPKWHATVISAASARRTLNKPRREDKKCLRPWGQSIHRFYENKTDLSVQLALIQLTEGTWSSCSLIISKERW